MIRVAVIDDEPLARQGVITRLAAHTDLQLYGEYADGDIAYAGMITDPPELAFVDVQMPGRNGLELLAALPAQKRPLAILLTAHESFAVQAFALNALDYLLKPIDCTRFDEAVERARRQLNLHRTPEPSVPASAAVERFSVRIGHRDVLVRVVDIEWIEADGDYAKLHLVSGDVPLRESLQQLDQLLDPTLFVRVHRSAIVRIDQVVELQPLPNRDAMVRLRNGTPIRVSRRYIDKLLARLHIANR